MMKSVKKTIYNQVYARFSIRVTDQIYSMLWLQIYELVREQIYDIIHHDIVYNEVRDKI